MNDWGNLDLFMLACDVKAEAIQQVGRIAWRTQASSPASRGKHTCPAPTRAAFFP